MKVADYAAQDAIGLAALIRAKDVSQAEVLEAAQAALTAANRKLNFLVGELMEAAEAGGGPFLGAPLLIKDIGAPVAGWQQESGSRLAEGLVAREDSELTRRLRRAGFRFVGRSATPELGSAFSTEPVAHGATRNPWNPEMSCGGSSGGAAAAVASGAIAVAHGGDSAGSIRIPAHCCGVFGLKPSRGRNPAGPQAAEVNSGLTCAHVLTRSVRDSAAVLDAIAGADVGCHYTAPPDAAHAFSNAVQRGPKKLRIAVATTSPLAREVAADVTAAVLEAARLCETFGHDVALAGPSFDADEFVGFLEVIWSANIAQVVARLEFQTGRKRSADTLEHATLAMARRGAATFASEFIEALSRMNRFNRAFCRFFEDYDVLLTPVLSTAAPPLGMVDPPVRNLTDYVRDIFAFAPFTAQFNVSGQPAMSVPFAMSAEGLPIGVHAAARYGEEATLFALAGQLEEARPWAARRPAVRVGA